MMRAEDERYKSDALIGTTRMGSCLALRKVKLMGEEREGGEEGKGTVSYNEVHPKK